MQSFIDATTSVSNNPANLESLVQIGNRLEKLGNYIERMSQRIKGNGYFDGGNRNSSYILYSRKYFYYYVGHYDNKKYENQMKKFKRGELKSRPNGRKWCKVKSIA